MSLCWIIWIIIMHHNILRPQEKLFWHQEIQSLSLGTWKQLLALFQLTVCSRSVELNLSTMLCLGSCLGITCDLYPSQAEWRTPHDSLKASWTEMSLITSNMWWQLCRNGGQPRSNWISKESKTPRIWDRKDTTTAQAAKNLFECSQCHFTVCLLFVLWSKAVIKSWI